MLKQEIDPWTNAHVLATFLVGSSIIVALIVYEKWFKKDGLFHHDLFRYVVGLIQLYIGVPTC